MAATALGASVIGSLYNADQQRKDTERLRKKQESEAARLANEKKEQDAKVDATRKRDAARARQRLQIQGSQGQRDTILSGGANAYTGQGRKTLLGL